jgi:WD40 repeat protein
VVGTLSFDQSGKLLATGDWSSTVRVWSVPDGTLVRKEKLGGNNNGVKKVLITSDGRWLVSCAGNNVWVHALDKGGETHMLRGHSDLVTLLAVDEASQWLASGSWDGTVRLWNIANLGLEEYVLGGHVTGISDIAFSPDGTRLATTVGNAEVLLWDITNPKAIPIRLSAPWPVAAVEFGPEGQKVFAMTESGGVTIWDLDVNNLVELGCKLVGRALSKERLRRLHPDLLHSLRCLPK